MFNLPIPTQCGASPASVWPLRDLHTCQSKSATFLGPVSAHWLSGSDILSFAAFFSDLIMCRPLCLSWSQGNPAALSGSFIFLETVAMVPCGQEVPQSVEFSQSPSAVGQSYGPCVGDEGIRPRSAASTWQFAIDLCLIPSFASRGRGRNLPCRGLAPLNSCQ